MIEDIKTLKEIFAHDKEGLDDIAAWEKKLTDNAAFIEWQKHDVTREIIRKCRQSYRDISVALAENRTLTDDERYTLWARQDAMMWLLSLIADNIEEENRRIQEDIRYALSAT